MKVLAREGERRVSRNKRANITGTHHVGIVPGGSFVLYVGRVNCDTTGLLFRGFVNVLVSHFLAPPVSDNIVVIAAVKVVLPWSTCLQKKEKRMRERIK